MKNNNNIKQPRILLKLDFNIQILIAFLSLVCAFIYAEYFLFIGIYFILGAWQLLSFLVHLKRRIYNLGVIRNYAKIILGLFVLGLLCVIFNFLNWRFLSVYIFFYLFVMLLSGPVLAIWYMVLTYNDLQSTKDRIN